MSVQIRDGTVGYLAKVDANGNLATALPQVKSQSGFVRIQTSDGSDIDVTENNCLRTSTSNIIFYDQVDGSAIDTNKWSVSSSTLTAALSNGFIVLNSGNSTAAGGYFILASNKFIPMYATSPVTVEINAKFTNLPEANCTMEIGVGAVSGTSTPTDGAYFRFTPAGQLSCYLNNAGAESATSPLSGTVTDANGSDTVSFPLSSAVNHLFRLEIAEDNVQFLIDDILVQTISTPSGQNFPFNSGRQQIFTRIWNGTTPATAATVSIGQVMVKQDDVNMNRSWGETLTSLGRGAYQSPTTFTQIANHTNSTSPTSATLSNTAAGYTTLGGRWQFAAVAGAVTDFALFAFQVPVGYQMFVNSISISSVNTAAIGSAVTPTIIDWGIGINSSAVSLATADGAGTWAPRRIPLGLQAFGLTAAIGATASDVTRRFEAPLVVDSGRFFHVIAQVPTGAATGSQIFRGNVEINGFFE